MLGYDMIEGYLKGDFEMTEKYEAFQQSNLLSFIDYNNRQDLLMNYRPNFETPVRCCKASI